MTIQYVGAASATSTSVSLPTFQAGDVAFVLALRTTDATLPSVPTGWTRVHSSAAVTTTGVLGCRVLQDGDTSTGTWADATDVLVSVWRGANTLIPYDIASTSTLVTDYGLSPAYSTSSRVQMGYVNVGTITGSAGGTLRYGSGTHYGVIDGVGGFTTSGSASGRQFTFAIMEPSLYPIIADQDTTSGTVTSNSSSWTLTYPTNIAAGDLLIALVATDGDGGSGTTWPSGWVAGDGGSSAISLSLAKKSATGSETGTFSVSLFSSEQGSWTVYRVPAGTWEGTLGTTWASETTADGAVCAIRSVAVSQYPDPSNHNPAYWDLGYTLWIAAMSADTSRTVSAYPSSPDTFTNTASLVSGGSNGATLAWGRLEKNASSVNPGTFTISNSDDWIAVTIAIRSGPRTGGFTADAQIVNRKTGSFSADAYFASAGGPTTRYGSFSADAVLFANSGTKTFASDATKLKTQSGSFTADATSQRSQSGSFSANAVIHRSQSGSVTSDAIAHKAQAGSFTADAQMVVVRTGSLTSDAIVLAASTRTFSADAVIASTATGSLTGDAVFAKEQTGSVTSDAISLLTQTGSLSANATIKRAQSGSITSDAIRKRTMYFGSGPDPR